MTIQYRTPPVRDQVGHPLLSDQAFFACQLNLNVSLCLLTADLALIGQKETWFELFFSRDQSRPNLLSFTLHLAGFEHARPYDRLRVHFGSLGYDVQLDASGTARWSLPCAEVLDRKSRRIMRPIKLSLPTFRAASLAH